MHSTIDAEGRITLVPEMLNRLGLQPGDKVVLENRGGECVIRAAMPAGGLCFEGSVLVHRGVSGTSSDDVLADLRESQVAELADGLTQ